MRILIADDYADWRMKIREILNYSSQCQIIDEACDGREAVEKATRLQPELVILDLSMPQMNGIQAARLIRQRSPSTRIIFFSEDLDADVQQAALAVGHDYVSKGSATRDLLPAIERIQAAAAFDRVEFDPLSSRI